MTLLLEVAKKAEEVGPTVPTCGWSVGHLAHLGLMLSCDGFRARLDHHNLNLLFDIVEEDSFGEVRTTDGDILEVETRDNGVVLLPEDGFETGLLLDLKTLKEMGIEQYEAEVETGDVLDLDEPNDGFTDLDAVGTMPEVENLDEGVRKAFRRVGKKIKRGFRVTSGFRKGRVVASARAAFKPRKKAATRMKLRIAARRKKVIRVMKGKRTRRKPMSRRLVRMNKTLSPKKKR